MSELVKENLTKAQKKQKTHYDKKSKPQNLKAGNEVLVFETAIRNKLQLEWNGPFQVRKQVSEVDYEVETPGRRKEKKVYHVNLLRKWQKPKTEEVFTTLSDMQQENSVRICEDEDLEEFLFHTDKQPDGQEEITFDVNPMLFAQQRSKLEDLLHEFSDLFRANWGVLKHLNTQLMLEMPLLFGKHFTASLCPRDRW